MDVHSVTPLTEWATYCTGNHNNCENKCLWLFVSDTGFKRSLWLWNEFPNVSFKVG